MEHTELELKHLDMVQSHVMRLDARCFVIRMWALMSLYFWGLDAYYRRRKLLYRALYASIRGGKLDDEHAMIMDTLVIEKRVDGRIEIFLTPPLLIFHTPLFLITVIMLIVAMSG